MNSDYELLDSGQGRNEKGEYYGEKLERFGQYVLRRPDPEVLWHKRQSDEVWNAADATFVVDGLSRKWQFREGSDLKVSGEKSQWITEVGGLRYTLAFGAFKHVGIFPEQVEQWKWMTEKIHSAQNAKVEGKKAIKVLNLFGYTGGATCVLARAGAEVTHVDALEANLARTKENLALNGLAEAPVRLIADDVRKFVEREIRRGAQYDAVVMDPPVYGKGDKKRHKGKSGGRSKKNEWHIEDDFLPLLGEVKKLLSDTPLLWVISGYASEYSALSYANALQDVLGHVSIGASIESGELSIPESLKNQSAHNNSRRSLPAGIFARITFFKGF